MTRYAENTSVSTEKSRAQIESTLERYGATGFQYGWQETGHDRRKAMIEFIANDRRIRFILPLPSRDDSEFIKTKTGKRRSESAALASWEQACRQRWRALHLAIKAKLEAVECNITEFEREFLAHIVDPETNRTVGELVLPMIEDRYEGKPTQLALPAPSRS